MAGSLHLVRSQVHLGWSRDFPPVATVASGTEITVETQDASGGQLVPGSTAASVAALDFSRVNPVSGPVYVEGARPGDVLQVDVLEVVPGTYGWTAIIPGFGLLADRYPEPWLHVWELDRGAAVFSDRIRVPLSPFCGVLGVAPGEPGVHSVVPPRRVGGNLDTRQLGPGSSLYLPVEVEGALFGVGDTHAAQGDGEVCGTAIEAPMTVTVRLSVRRDLQVDAPEFDVTRPLERESAAAAGYHATSGVAPNLMEATRQSVERMIVYLERTQALSPQQAYALCSVAVDLRISEVVDAPNWVVSAFCPRDLFAS
ncbi:MAG TPA: acetamidase/formamidase family protein [Acidimicrobiales bacterium]|nr:acetamidase/formamidase family protein [Acidimicrobiales bacterium]